MRVAVLRRGRLGDLVMTLPALQGLVAAGLDATLLCEPHYARLMTRLAPGLTVWPLGDADGPLGTGRIDAGRWAPEPVDALLDLHRTPWSAPVRRALTVRGPTVSVRKETLARQGLIPGWGRPRRTWPERHLDAAARLLASLGVNAPVPDARPRAPEQARGGATVLAVGAGELTKQWPIERFAGLAARLRDAGHDVVVVGAPAEASRVYRAAPPGTRALLPPTPEALVDVLLGARLLVGGDTGTTWLAGALGVRVVALFGPTPVGAGFFVWGEPSAAVASTAGCSPCSMHGGSVCPRRHHRCLRELPVDAVVAAVGAP